MELTITQGRAAGAENRVIITLAGVVTIGEVDELKVSLVNALAACGELLLDVGEITATDPALLQLIHAACCTAGNEGKKFVLVGEFSAAFQETACAAGF
jgi:anti-anti-sigma regulatory factor